MAYDALACATETYFVRTHRPSGILPIFQALAMARPLKATLAALGATTIDRMDACCTAGNQNARVSGTTITAWACYSAKCWTITPTTTRGGKQYPNILSPVSGNLDTSCASTSVPHDPSQSCCEKKGNRLLLPGTFWADSEEAMISKLNEPKASHSSWNVSGARRMMDSRTGRELSLIHI